MQKEAGTVAEMAPEKTHGFSTQLQRGLLPEFPRQNQRKNSAGHTLRAKRFASRLLEHHGCARKHLVAKLLAESTDGVPQHCQAVPPRLNVSCLFHDVPLIPRGLRRQKTQRPSPAGSYKTGTWNMDTTVLQICGPVFPPRVPTLQSNPCPWRFTRSAWARLPAERKSKCFWFSAQIIKGNHPVSKVLVRRSQHVSQNQNPVFKWSAQSHASRIKTADIRSHFMVIVPVTFIYPSFEDVAHVNICTPSNLSWFI